MMPMLDAIDDASAAADVFFVYLRFHLFINI